MKKSFWCWLGYHKHEKALFEKDPICGIKECLQHHPQHYTVYECLLCGNKTYVKKFDAF
jgi:hypothetical protein